MANALAIYGEFSLVKPVSAVDANGLARNPRKAMTEPVSQQFSTQALQTENKTNVTKQKEKGTLARQATSRKIPLRQKHPRNKQAKKNKKRAKTNKTRMF